MADIPIGAWVALGIGAVVAGVIFAPAGFWEWMIRLQARAEGKSVARFKREVRIEAGQAFIGNPVDGSGG